MKAFYEDSFSYFGSIIILLLIPLVAVYSNHSAIKGYAKAFFLADWLLCCICLKIVISISDENMRKIREWVGRNERIILSMIVCSYIFVFFGLAKLKYINFGGYETDNAHFIRFFYNAYRGQYLSHTGIGDSVLGIHVSPILYVFLVPFFVYPSINTILFLKSAMIGLSAIPLYSTIKRKHAALVALLIVFSYLLFHQIAGAIVIDFHEVVFAPFFLLYAYYFFEREDYIRFLIFFLLSLTIKENIVFVLFVFGVYGLILRRGKKWVLTPIMVSACWLYLSLNLLLPYFSSGKTLSVLHTGSIRKFYDLLVNPYGTLVHLMDVRWLGLIYTFLQPVLFFIPLLSIEFIFVVPWLLIKLLVGGNPQVRTWHFLIISGFLFIAFSNSLHKIGNVARYKRIVLVISVIAVFVSISGLPYWFRPEEYMAKPYWGAQREAVELIPMKASVCAPEYMLSYLADRRDFYNEVSFQQEMRRDIDFIIFDSNIKHYRIEWQNRENVPKFIRNLRKLAPLKKSYLNYDYYWERDGIFIYKNKGFEFTE